MIKGIVALFTSGKIFEPMILLGILLGFTMASLVSSWKELFSLYGNALTYLAAFLIASVYVWCFRRVYTEGREKVDAKATLLVSVARTFDLVLANVFTILFALALLF